MIFVNDNVQPLAECFYDFGMRFRGTVGQILS